MAKRITVHVSLINKDLQTNKDVVVRRKDMDFPVLVNDIGDAKTEAKALFEKAHGPDLLVRTCNMSSRSDMVLYGCSKQHHPSNIKARDLPFIRQLPARRR